MPRLTRRSGVKDCIVVSAKEKKEKRKKRKRISIQKYKY